MDPSAQNQFVTALQIICLVTAILGTAVTFGILIHTLQTVVRDLRTLRHDFEAHAKDRELHPSKEEVREIRRKLDKVLERRLPAEE